MLRKTLLKCFLFSLLLISNVSFAKQGLLVLQTDFGLNDGAVSAMKGVIYQTDRSIIVTDLTHGIPPYHIWDAAYRLFQTAPYWPQGTVFVSVVDPGVGTTRRSVVARSKNDQYFVTPDNGTLTLIAEKFGIKEVRSIDESKHRRQGSEESYTFHGRDVYAYTAAKLASGQINFEEVGPIQASPVVKIPYTLANITDNQLVGSVSILDNNFGNIWTNIPQSLAQKWGLEVGKEYKVSIYHKQTKIFGGKVTMQKTFGAAPLGANILYLNSLMYVSIATNQGNFAKRYHIEAGPDWRVVISH